MKTMTLYDHELHKHHQIPSNATHYMFASGYGVYYKIGATWIHQGDAGCQQVVYDFDAIDYSQVYSKPIFDVHDFTEDNPVIELKVDIDNECKERVGQVFGGFPVGEQFISSGFIKKSDLMIGLGWRIGDGYGFASRFVMAHTKSDLDLLSEFAPDFTKHKDCDIAVIRDIVEQYRKKIKQLQESKK